MDPRLTVVDKRLAGVKRLIAVTGGKGGIGKSVVASTLALLLARQDKRTGLLDLDLTGPSDHVILGAPCGFPSEEFGIEPPSIDGIGFMSVALFAGTRPAPLRGTDITNALLELLAITRWGELDFLVIDMPPGLGDATLDAVRLLRRAEYLAVATGSRVVLETVRKTLRFHVELQTHVLGLVENMQRRESPAVRGLAVDFGLPYLGALPHDEALEGAIGDPARLARTAFAVTLEKVSRALLSDDASSRAHARSGPDSRLET
jgi:ATP-binding protein involved in chromosome partitioning